MTQQTAKQMPEECDDIIDNHEFMSFARNENFMSTYESNFEKWIKKAEKLIGHCLDGNQDTDGYSYDYAHDAFADGVTPEQYVAEVVEYKAVIAAQVQS